MTILRIEGIAASVNDRFEQLSKALGAFGSAESIADDASRPLWTGIRDVSCFAADHAPIIWRLSLPPANGADAVRKITNVIPGSRAVYDWSGGLVWIAIQGSDALSEIVRPFARHFEGHATLFRAPSNLRASVQVMPPLEPSLMALTARVKQQFDPKRVLNPGRMYAEI
jgi:glycolate oxidase FAD binding subunit